MGMIQITTLAVVSENKDMMGEEIREIVGEIVNRDMDRGQIYNALRKLIDRGLVTSSTHDKKKLYNATQDGRDALNNIGDICEKIIVR